MSSRGITAPSVNSGTEANEYRIDLERRLIGWMMRNEFDAAKHAEPLRDMASAFHQPHDKIVAAIFAIVDSGSNATPSAVAFRLAGDQRLIELGGREFLVQWSYAAPTLISEIDARLQIERTITEYSNILVKKALEERTAVALDALRSGSPDAVERIAELSHDAEALVSSRSIVANPFEYRSPEEIPIRRWLFGRHAIRGFISATAGSGGTGKTALAIAEGLALVTGKNLLGDQPVTPHLAWYLGLEDPLEEYERRTAAAMLLHKIAPREIIGRLFVNIGRGGEFVIASEDRGGLFINRPTVSAIIRNIRKNNIALLTVDPFVACHTVAEADNTKIAAVAREWAAIADETGCAVELIHHVRKGSGSAHGASVDDARGASAFINATRSARLLMTMTKEEAERGSISPDERRRYFKVTNAKANLATHGNAGVWRVLNSINLGNGRGGPDDLVGAVSAWEMPSAADFVDAGQRTAIIARIRVGEWRLNHTAEAWAGHAVAAVLDIDVTGKSTRWRVRAVLDAWIRDGLLKVETRLDQKRMPRKFVVPG